MLVRRYFAFILMLFAVVANASDSHTTYAGSASGSVRLVFVNKLNEILSSNIQKANIAVKKQNVDKKGFGDILEGQENFSLTASVFLSIAFIYSCLFRNNGIVKNSIWKSAVF